MNNNKIKFKAYGAAITALVIVAVILLNVIFGVVGKRYNLKVDITKGGVFTLSNETKNVLDMVKKDITIYYATNADSRNTGYAEILDNFAKYSKHITIKDVNIDLDPNFKKTYQVESYNTVVVECPNTGKKRVIDSSLIEQSSNNSKGTVATSVNYLESYVSAAVLYSISSDPLDVYISVGHGEITENTTFLDHLMSMLYSEAMSVRVLDLTAEQIPENADMILIAGPKMDFTADEIKKVDDYFEKGGRVQFYSNPAYSLPNLNAYLNDSWKIQINNDCVSDDDGKYLAKSSIGSYLLPVIKESDMTKYLSAIGAKFRVQEGETNSIKVTENKNIQANVLLTTSEKGISLTRDNWVKKNSRQSYVAQNNGEQTIMIYCKKNPLNNESTTARLLVCGSYYMLYDNFIDPSSNYADKDLVVKSINYMSGIEDAPVSVASKQVLNEQMKVLEIPKLVSYGVILVAAIPVILFIWGVYVYIRRKRL